MHGQRVGYIRVSSFDQNLQRQREGIALAKQRGVYRGRTKSLSPEQAATLKQRVAAGEKKAGLAREFGISRETLYQYLRDSATISEGSDV